MKTYDNQNDAEKALRIRNRSYALANNYKDLCVMVDGPEDGEFTLMDIREAVSNEFTYQWASI